MSKKEFKDIITFKDGRIFKRLSYPLVIEAEIMGRVGCFRDITEKTNVDKALKKAVENAEAANKAKSNFLATMSHEIRTPMNGIIGMANFLLESDLTTEQKEYADIVRTSADNLLNIINDILDFSKIEAGKLEFETIDFNLNRTIEDIVQVLTVPAGKKRLELIHFIPPDVPVLLRGDPGRLRQVIMNLANNAVKFTEEGEVAIEVTKTFEADSFAELRFEIRDTGIGIPEDRQNRLFQSFSQVDSSTTRKFGGTGLGLAISKKLVHMMKGEIGVSSREKEGSTFFFTARFEIQNLEREVYIRTPLEITGKRILVVDDNTTSCKVISAYLESWGCRRDCAFNAEDGLKMLRQSVKDQDPYEIAIIDDIMPMQDGRSLGRMIKADVDLASTRMMMITASGMRGDAAAIKEIGFEAYLNKPIRKSLLYDCIVTLVGDNSRQAPLNSSSLITRYSLSDRSVSDKKILLVEDNKINQKVARKILDGLGYSVRIADDGQIALKMLQAEIFDLVLMDVQMPNMDGYEATTLIRSTNDNTVDPKIPVIAMTANALKGDREKCLQSGMDDYLSKPIDPQELAAKLQIWLS